VPTETEIEICALLRRKEEPSLVVEGGLPLTSRPKSAVRGSTPRGRKRLGVKINETPDPESLQWPTAGTAGKAATLTSSTAQDHALQADFCIHTFRLTASSVFKPATQQLKTRATMDQGTYLPVKWHEDIFAVDELDDVVNADAAMISLLMSPGGWRTLLMVAVVVLHRLRPELSTCREGCSGLLLQDSGPSSPATRATY